MNCLSNSSATSLRTWIALILTTDITFPFDGTDSVFVGRAGDDRCFSRPGTGADLVHHERSDGSATDLTGTGEVFRDSERTFFGSVGQASGVDECPVESGVPHGSVGARLRFEDVAERGGEELPLPFGCILQGRAHSECGTHDEPSNLAGCNRREQRCGDGQLDGMTKVSRSDRTEHDFPSSDALTKHLRVRGVTDHDVCAAPRCTRSSGRIPNEDRHVMASRDRSGHHRPTGSTGGTQYEDFHHFPFRLPSAARPTAIQQDHLELSRDRARKAVAMTAPVSPAARTGSRSYFKHTGQRSCCPGTSHH